jgi:hypothetical protein
MGAHATGIIMYTPDGYLSVQIHNPPPPPPPPEETPRQSLDVDVTDAQWADIGSRSSTYTGPFYLDEEPGDAEGRPILLHHMRVSNLPWLLGKVQRRLVSFRDESDGRHLLLRVDGLMDVRGEQRRVELDWRKLPQNRAKGAPVGSAVP